MLKLNLILFGGRGQSFTIKRDTIVRDTINNTNIVMPTRTKVKNVIVIAGDDRKRKIDEIDSLVKSYGGKKKNWSKRRAETILKGKRAELHYYQNKKDKIGRVKYKVKRWL